MQARKITILLTPRNDENDFSRSIILTPSHDPVVIGRASKTASKGLLPLSGNAWFNSPIMSREHGKLFMTPDGEVRIQDSGSTHGTWIGPRRLASQESAKISHGDIVTFGTTVTSGPMTYHARSFDVRISSTCDEVSPNTIWSKKSGSSTFSVPNDDIESLSDDSDPGSCQILDSHPRTFSVPSSDNEVEDSDEDDVVIPTSRRLFLASVNAVDSQKSHIPHSKLHTSVANRGSDSHDKQTKCGAPEEARSLPSSQKENAPITANTSENDSEEEGPDVIHWGHGQHSSRVWKTGKEDTAAASMLVPEVQIPETYQSPDPPTLETGSPSQETDGHKWQPTATSVKVPETNLFATDGQDLSTEQSSQDLTDSSTKDHISFHNSARASDSGQPNLSQYESSVEYDQVSSSEPGDNQNRNCSHQQEGGSRTENPSNLSQSSSSSYEQDDTLASEGTSAQAGSDRAYLPMKDTEQDKKKQRFEDLVQEEWDKYSEHEALPKSQGSSYPPFSRPLSYEFYPNSSEYQYSWHLCHDKPVESHPLALSSAFRQLDGPSINTVASQSHSAMARPPSPSDAALPKFVTPGQTETHKPFGTASNRDAIRPHPEVLNHGRSGHIFTSRYELPPAKFLGDLRSNPSMRVHRSSLESILAQASDDWKNEQAKERDCHRPKPAPKPDGYQQGPFSRSFDSFHTAAESSQGDTESTGAPRKQCLVKLKVDNPVTDSREPENSMNMSRVQISNLVNSQGEGSRGKKRKSGQMSSEELPSTVNTPFHTVSVPGITQTKDGHHTAPVANNSMSEGKDTLNVKATDLPKIPTDEEGPARKKAKTADSKRGTIGKVVSGICLGVAGAFAALVAATPTDVWEEALREAIKLQ